MAEKVKLVILGNKNVGKTTMIFKFLNVMPLVYKDNTADATYSRPLDDKGQRYVELFDTSGKAHQIQSGNAYIIVYSSVSAQSFKWASSRVYEVRNSFPIAPIALVANKADVDETKQTPKVSRALGEQLAEETGCLFSETSASEGKNVMETFNAISTAAFSIVPAPPPTQKPLIWSPAEGRKCGLLRPIAFFLGFLVKAPECSDPM